MSKQHEYFVYDGIEVIKTGRIASKDQQVRGYNGTRKVTEVVVEITPVPRSGELSWKRWVREDELYIIDDVADGAELPVDPMTLPTDPIEDPLDEVLNSLRGKHKDGSA